MRWGSSKRRAARNAPGLPHTTLDQQPSMEAPSKPKSSLLFGTRQVMVFALCFAVTLLAYVDRVGFSIAYTKLAAAAGTSQETKGSVMSSFYWGYATTQIPCAWFAAKFGGVRMLTLSVCLSTFAAIITPSDGTHFLWLYIARILVGVAQGAIFPSIHTELGKWKDAIGVQWFSTVVSIITSGMYLGSAAAMLILPQVAAGSPVSVFHLQAALGVLWLIGWISINWEVFVHGPAAAAAAASPDDKLEAGKAETDPMKVSTASSIPWGRLLRTPAIWALVANNFAFHYIVYVLMAWLPTYYEHGLHMDLGKSKLLNSMPFVMMFIFSNLSGVVADRLIGKMGISVGKTRKLLNTGGFVTAAAALVILPSVENPTVGCAGIAVVLGACATARGGFALNHLDVAPTYAGSVMSVANTAGTLAGIIGVHLTGVLLSASGGVDFSAVFGLLACICLVGSAIFITLGTGERLF